MGKSSPVPMKDPTTYIDIEECLRLERNAPNIRDKLIIALLWRDGLRVQELIQLKKKNVFIDDNDIDNSIIVVLGKGKKYRRVPLNIGIIPILYQFIEHKKPNEYLFSSYSNQKYLTKQYVGKLLKRIGRMCGVVVDKGGKSIHCHTMRHSCAIILLNRGVPIPKIQQILGHSSLSSTTFYLQFSKKELAEDYHKAMNSIPAVEF